MLTLTGFGQTSLSGVPCGFMPPQLKTKQNKTSINKLVKIELVVSELVVGSGEQDYLWRFNSTRHHNYVT